MSHVSHPHTVWEYELYVLIKEMRDAWMGVVQFLKFSNILSKMSHCFSA